MITVFGAALLYYLYVLSLPEWGFAWVFNYFGYHFKYYTQFILPTHSFDLIPCILALPDVP